MAMDKDRNQPRLLPHGENVAKTASNGPRWQATNDSGARKILDPTKRGLAYATSEAAPSPSIHRPSAIRIPDRLLAYFLVSPLYKGRSAPSLLAGDTWYMVHILAMGALCQVPPCRQSTGSPCIHSARLVASSAGRTLLRPRPSTVDRSRSTEYLNLTFSLFHFIAFFPPLMQNDILPIRLSIPRQSPRTCDGGMHLHCATDSVAKKPKKKIRKEMI